MIRPEPTYSAILAEAHTADSAPAPISSFVTSKPDRGSPWIVCKRPLTPGMVLRVELPQTLPRDVCIDLGGRNIAVAQ